MRLPAVLCLRLAPANSLLHDRMMRADICSPELAKYIRGELDELVVDGKDDIWALGVLALYLTTGQHPFPVVEDGADLPAKVQRIAALQEEDIAAAISEAGVEKGKQLESFLLKCLQLERAQRSTARQLMASGYTRCAEACIRTVFSTPVTSFLTHFLPIFPHFSPIFSVWTPGIQRTQPEVQ
eukprot:COSAG04_NODE_6303_length_1361_cov_1.839937_1_plen_182_part_10